MIAGVVIIYLSFDLLKHFNQQLNSENEDQEDNEPDKVNENINVIEFICTEKGELKLSDDELLENVRDLLFYVRNDDQPKVTIAIPEHNDLRSKYEILRNRKDLTEKEKNIRGILQKQFNNVDKKNKFITDAILLLFQAPGEYTNYLTDRDYASVVNGIFSNTLHDFGFGSGLKIDIYIRDNLKFSTSFTIEEDEVKSFLDAYTLSNSSQLASDVDVYWAAEMPSSIFNQKAIPAIICHLVWLSHNENKEINHYQDYLNPLLWRVGLG